MMAAGDGGNAMAEAANIVEVTQQNFRQVVLEESFRRPVLVDFWADWCQPCKMLMPVLTKLVNEYAGGFLLAKLDTEREQALAAHFQIRSLPTLMLFHQGRPVEQLSGVQPEGVIRAMLQKVALSPTERVRQQARLLLTADRSEEAERVLREALAAAPTEHALRVDLARLRAAAGDSASAQALLDELPANVREEPEARALRAQLKFLDLARELPPQPALEQRLAADPADADAAFKLALHAILAGDYERAMERLSALVQRHRDYGDDLARKTLLELFELLGADDPLVKQYRRRMFAALY
jgi:putative thioredoxin